jgi:Uma2 family endonuclease
MAAKVLAKTRKQAMNGQLAEPAWDVALLYPLQGHWSEDDYLALDGDRTFELSNGNLEVLPMPTTSHAVLIRFFFRLLDDLATSSKLGLTLPGGIRVQLWSGEFRVPDVVFMLAKNRNRAEEEFWLGADLVMEVVSGSSKDRTRDLVTKKAEYARAGIQEYWIVDPKRKVITVLTLKGKKYEVHGEFKKGMTATSLLLPGYQVDVTAAFAATLR